MLINVKMPTIVGILTWMSTIHVMLSWVEPEKKFYITPDPVLFASGRVWWNIWCKIVLIANIGSKYLMKCLIAITNLTVSFSDQSNMSFQLWLRLQAQPLGCGKQNSISIHFPLQHFKKVFTDLNIKVASVSVCSWMAKRRQRTIKPFNRGFFILQ